MSAGEEQEPQFEARGFAPEPEQPEGGMSAEEADKMMGAGPHVGEGPEADMIREAVGGDPGELLESEVSEPEQGTEEEPKQAKIKIGNREFANSDEAWAYAQELETEKMTNDAFRHGLEVAQKAAQGNQPEPEPEEEEIPPEIMYDPKKMARYVNDKMLAAKDAAKREIDQERARNQRNTDTWAEFYKDYPDLTNAQELVQMKLNENWERLKHVDTKMALKEVATQARALKSKIAGDAAPGRELPQVRTVTSSGRKGQVTTAKTEAQPLNFIQQMQNMNKKRTARR